MPLKSRPLPTLLAKAANSCTLPNLTVHLNTSQGIETQRRIVSLEWWCITYFCRKTGHTKDILEEQRCLCTNPNILKFPRDSSLQLRFADVPKRPDIYRVLIDDSQIFQRIVIPPRSENFIIDHYHSFK